MAEVRLEGQAPAKGGALWEPLKNASHVMEAIIKNVVVDNLTHESPSRRSTRSLQKYLVREDTVDVVYSKIIEQMMECTGQFQPFLFQRSAFLMKQYLQHYPPSREVLSMMDNYFRSACTATSNPAQKKTLAFLGVLIQAVLNRSPTKLLATPTSSRQEKEEASQMTRASNVVSLTGSENSSTESLPNLKDLLESNAGMNLLVKRVSALVRQAPLFHKDNLFIPTSTYELFFMPLSFNMGVETKDSMNFENAATLRKRILAVSVEKKLEDTKIYKELGAITVRRKGIQLFEYKYYSEQEPLILSDSEVEEVVSAIRDTTNHDVRLIATKIFIKYFIDIYVRGDHENANGLFVSLCFELLGKSADSRLHALNMLFNLSVHLNMFAKLELLAGGDFSGWTEGDASGETKVLAKQQQLFGLLKDLIMPILLDGQEKDERVWSAAFNALLLFVSKEGKLIRSMLSQLDPRVIKTFMENVHMLSETDQSYRILVRMLVSLLYGPQSLMSSIEPLESENKVYSLDQKMLDSSFGGIDFLLHHFCHVRSIEAKCNLFSAIFDYFVQQVRATFKFPSTVSDVDSFLGTQTNLILFVLQRTNAPLFFDKLYKHMPSQFAASFVEHIFKPEVLFELDIPSSLVERVDRAVLREILDQWEKFGARQMQLDTSLEKKVSIALTSDNHKSVEDVLKSIRLMFDKPETSRQAEIMLCRILDKLDEDSSKILPSLVNKVLQSMVQSKIPAVRRAFLCVTERNILSKKSKITRNEKDVQAIIARLNRHFKWLVQVRESDDINLNYMSDILFNLIAVCNVPHLSTGNGESFNDTVYELFLQGKAIVVPKLLDGMDSVIFKYLFVKIPIRTKQRVCWFLMLINRCRRQGVNAAGGMAFFRGLLTNRDPEIAYHASAFLIEQLQAENPEEYRTIVNRLMDRARQTHDEKILSNPYLQIQALISGI